MKKQSQKNKFFTRVIKFLRIAVIILCVGGYSYQMQEFFEFYWIYPTIVDIQTTEPTSVKIPSFTICNPNGYNFQEICNGLEISPCISPKPNDTWVDNFCETYSKYCYEANRSLPNDFLGIDYDALNDERLQFTQEILEKIKQPADKFAECHIYYAGVKTNCDSDFVMASFYSKSNLPQFCYTFYSLWGNPGKERPELIKGSRIELKIFLNLTRREKDTDTRPLYNLLNNPSVQIGFHSPFFMPNPFVVGGTRYLAGKRYELRLSENIYHLLPAPYKTNCTDFMTEWVKRGGKGPIDQRGIYDECRMEKYFEKYGCVPMDVDYPHLNTVCGGCGKDPCNYTINEEECMELAYHYNQPCESIRYTVEKEQVNVEKKFRVRNKILGLDEVMKLQQPEFNCSGRNFWIYDCSYIEIHIMFDRFEISEQTYIPKIESLEMFSVMGGYMGMWLGISLVAVYDFASQSFKMFKSWNKNRTKRIRREKQKKINALHSMPSRY